MVWSTWGQAIFLLWEPAVAVATLLRLNSSFCISAVLCSDMPFSLAAANASKKRWGRVSSSSEDSVLMEFMPTLAGYLAQVLHCEVYLIQWSKEKTLISFWIMQIGVWSPLIVAWTKHYNCHMVFAELWCMWHTTATKARAAQGHGKNDWRPSPAVCGVEMKCLPQCKKGEPQLLPQSLQISCKKRKSHLYW